MKKLSLITLLALSFTGFSFADESMKKATSDMIACNTEYVKANLEHRIEKVMLKIARLEPEDLEFYREKLLKKIAKEQEKLALLKAAAGYLLEAEASLVD
jgi:hypothetical protein